MMPARRIARSPSASGVEAQYDEAEAIERGLLVVVVLLHSGTRSRRCTSPSSGSRSSGPGAGGDEIDPRGSVSIPRCYFFHDGVAMFLLEFARRNDSTSDGFGARGT